MESDSDSDIIPAVNMYENAAPPPAEPQQEAPRDIRGYFDAQRQQGMEYAADTPSEDYPPAEPINDFERASSLADSRIVQESSEEDDVPLRKRRLHDPHQQNMSVPAAQEHRSFQKPAKGFPLDPEKVHKRPGPKPWAAKPIAKNDMKAKMEVIRAIEKNWGKDFILNYIPKCHRPLQKKKNGKRTAYRQHEIDPKKWLPSVLKSVLMISELTNDKLFLKKAMNDIVRHRIKHTGNRKPQLVTTDFDVIEDMITRGWDIETSFSIRYKHLLLAQPKGYLETDADIDHILACGDDDFQPVSDEDGADNDDEMDVDGEEDDESMSSPYGKGGYIHGSPHQPPKKIIPKNLKQSKLIKQEFEKPAKSAKRAKSSARSGASESPQQMPPHPYGGYGMPGYGPYGGYPGFPPMPGYPPQQQMKGYPPPSMYGWPGQPMFPWPGQQAPNKDSDAQDPRAQSHTQGFPGYGYPNMSQYPPHPMSPPPSVPSSTPAPSATTGRTRFSPFGGRGSKRQRSTSYRADAAPTQYNASGYVVGPRIKREPGVEDQPISVEEDYDNAPSNYLGEADEEDDMDDEQMRNAIAEQERYVQSLKAQLAKKGRN